MHAQLTLLACMHLSLLSLLCFVRFFLFLIALVVFIFDNAWVVCGYAFVVLPFAAPCANILHSEQLTFFCSVLQKAFL